MVSHWWNVLSQFVSTRSGVVPRCGHWLSARKEKRCFLISQTMCLYGLWRQANQASALNHKQLQWGTGNKHQLSLHTFRVWYTVLHKELAQKEGNTWPGPQRNLGKSRSIYVFRPFCVQRKNRVLVLQSLYPLAFIFVVCVCCLCEASYAKLHTHCF